MGRALLFTGEPRIGKSTAVREVVERAGTERFRGFITGEDRSAGQRTGFSVTMLDGRRGILASIDSPSDIRVRGFARGEEVSYGVELNFLENVALHDIRASLGRESNKIIVIDEIGPMQLNSAEFKALILDVLQIDGVIIFGSVVLRSFPWTDELKERSDVETFLLTQQNRQTLTAMMSSYLVCRLDARGGEKIGSTGSRRPQLRLYRLCRRPAASRFSHGSAGKSCAFLWRARSEFCGFCVCPWLQCSARVGRW